MTELKLKIEETTLESQSLTIFLLIQSSFIEKNHIFVRRICNKSKTSVKY